MGILVFGAGAVGMLAGGVGGLLTGGDRPVEAWRGWARVPCRDVRDIAWALCAGMCVCAATVATAVSLSSQSACLTGLDSMPWTPWQWLQSSQSELVNSFYLAVPLAG